MGIYSLIFDVREMLTGRVSDKLWISPNMFPALLCALCCSSTPRVKVCLLYLIYNFVAALSGLTVQDVYLKYHAEVFVDNGRDSEAAWESTASSSFATSSGSCCTICSSSCSLRWCLWPLTLVQKALQNEARTSRMTFTKPFRLSTKRLKRTTADMGVCGQVQGR